MSEKRKSFEDTFAFASPHPLVGLRVFKQHKGDGTFLSTIKSYAVNGRTFLVETFEDGSWEVYRPVSSSLEISETLAALHLYLTDEGEDG